MIRLARRVSLLVALSLLTSAATAYAECAWVLWLHVPAPDLAAGEVMWSVKSASPSIGECRSEMKERVQRHKSVLEMARQQVRVEDDSLMSSSQDRGVHVYAYRCLPDTVDPRGPKGK